MKRNSTEIVSLARNNTDFQTQLLTYYRENKFDSTWDFLRYYQNVCRTYMRLGASRGLLMDVAMGLGKTLAGIAIAVDFIETHSVLMIMAKSIQMNTKNSIQKYIGLRAEADPSWPVGQLSAEDQAKWIAKHFKFVSMNASNMLGQLDRAVGSDLSADVDAALEDRLGEIVKMATLDHKTVIVDEAHDLFRAITHGSKNAVGFYDLAMRAKSAMFIFLTGTPIANNPFELAPCFNMLAGTTLFPENYKEFTEAYVGADGRIINRGKFQNRIMGLVSYVDHGSRQGSGVGHVDAGPPVEFPADLGTVVKRVVMSPMQYAAYRVAREKELAEASQAAGRAAPARLAIPKSTRASTYRVRSRQLSNYAPNEGHASPKFDAIWEEIQAMPGGLHVVYSQFKGQGGLGALAQFLIDKGMEPLASIAKSGGYDDDEYDGPADLLPPLRVGGWLAPVLGVGANLLGVLDSLDTVNTIHEPGELECVRLGLNWRPGAPGIALCSGTTCVVAKLVGNTYKVTEQVGKDRLGEVMGALARRQVKGGNDATNPRFAAITGDISVEERDEIVRRFSAKDNAHGEQCLVLLISASGAQSLDLKNIRVVHILEPYWTYGRIMQVKYRGIRSNSSVDLPAEEKNVKTIVYLAVAPGDDAAPTTDVEIYEDAVKAYVTITSFIEAIREVSIECSINNEEWCRVCAPTNRPLFGDWAQDMQMGDPCQEYKPKKIQGQSITVDNATYYWSELSTSVFGIGVYIMDPALNLHVKLPESDPRFIRVCEELGRM